MAKRSAGTDPEQPRQLDAADTAAALAEPFSSREVRWKPEEQNGKPVVNGEHILMTPYVDARTVMDRLDAVLGVGGWEDSFAETGRGDMLCTLRCRIAGEWVSKSDVGILQPGEYGTKGCVSDSLKR